MYSSSINKQLGTNVGHYVPKKWVLERSAASIANVFSKVTETALNQQIVVKKKYSDICGS